MNNDERDSLTPNAVRNAVTATMGTLVHQWTNTLNDLGSTVLNLREMYLLHADEAKVIPILNHLIEVTEGNQRHLRDYLRHLRLGEDNRIVPVNVNLAIQESLRQFHNQAGIEFRLNLTAELALARAKRRDLVLVINNLINNSITAIRQGEGEFGVIRIESRATDGKIAIEVSDNGPGIPFDVERIFDVGYSTSGGSGFGLYLSRQVLRSLGGEITLVSTGPKGTTFRILLNEWESSSGLAGTQRVLVVEDNEAQREALSYVLSRRGFQITSAGSIAEATRSIRSAAFDIALLDIRLNDAESPATSGLDLARMVREYNPDALIIVLSGYLEIEYLKEAFRVGVDDYLSKGDYGIEELMRRIEEALPRKLEEAAQQKETRRESIRREQQDRFIYETLSVFSHELRSPLLTAHWNTEALATGSLGRMTRKQIEAVASISAAIRREFVLLDTHLDLSRIERGIEALDYRSFDLVRIMKEEIVAHESDAKRKKIKINAVLPEASAKVRIDINRFRAALNPLMDNAIKFSIEGGEVSVSMTLQSRYVEVHISDQGPGIKPEELDRLLGRHVSPDVKLNQRIRSSGLGLSLANRIIEDYHEGKLWFVKKRNGETGTSVAFRLPIQSGEGDEP